MEMVKITDLTARLGISSRTLRYYEQAGLITSVRAPLEKYRYYDAANIARLEQILVLRKMQIPIKDILRIFDNEDMSDVVDVFVKQIQTIDGEVSALTELRGVVDDFLQAMLRNGITKISALPLLYEQMEKHLESIDNGGRDSLARLDELADRLERPADCAIRELPPMRLLSSGTDADGFARYVQAKGLAGWRERFERGDEILLRVPDGFENDGAFSEVVFEGGLYAEAHVYLDEDLARRFRAVVKAFDENKFYQLDYSREAMLENLIAPDDKRALVAMLVPVKKRVADASLFGAAAEVTGISVAEIEAASPVLWASDVPLESITPINSPHYKVLEDGTAEFTCWISTRALGTNVSVRLPFRVDMEFMLVGGDEQYGYGDHEGSMYFYHGAEDYFEGINMHQRGFGVNTDNHASEIERNIRFNQPVFRDEYRFPHRGALNMGVYNRLTWIVGDRYLAVIINGEVRFCGEGFPYMALDLRREKAYPVVIGSNGQGKKLFRSIRVSQLADTKIRQIDKGAIQMAARQSNNIISVLHRLITDEHGENYWFNGCARYVMECLGEPDYDYEFFAGLTGDVLAQHYCFGKFVGDGVDGYHAAAGDMEAYTEALFAKIGYAATCVPFKTLQKNTEMYKQLTMAYIDKNVPVIMHGYKMIVGYEENGSVLLVITGNNSEPERVPFADAIGKIDFPWVNEDLFGWTFVGEKKESRDLAAVYREAIQNLPKLLTMKMEIGVFGAAAFYAWADDITRGKFDGMKPEEFDGWPMYTTFVCAMATNGSCCHGFLARARELNPDMVWLEDVSKLYQRTADIWNNDSGKDLEALGGGFNVTLEALQDVDKRNAIAAKIREAGACIDEVLRIVCERL